MLIGLACWFAKFDSLRRLCDQHTFAAANPTLGDRTAQIPDELARAVVVVVLGQAVFQYAAQNLVASYKFAELLVTMTLAAIDL